MNRRALIIHSGPAGLQAALNLADSGLEVHLVEPGPYIGAAMAARLPRHLTNARLLDAVRHPRITLLTRTRLQSALANGRRCDITLTRQPRFVDTARCTNCKDCLEVCPVDVPGSDHKAIHIVDGLQPECAVIDKLGRSPCSAACPAGIHVQGYIALLAQERYPEALDLIRQAMPFAGICGRVCTHPCETQCRRNEVDEPVAIRSLKRFLADCEHQRPEALSIEPGQGHSTGHPGRQVAIIGSGPAGLTAAYHLCRLGYRVTVFEKLPVAGGMMAVGIPAYRLPRDILRAEIAAIQRMGVEIHTHTALGDAITLEGLARDGYRAFFIATGMHRSSRTHIPGEHLGGVVGGIDLLRRVSLGQPVGIGRRVVVIGGGNVAVDCAQTCLRMGAKQVTVLYRRTRAQMPAWDFEVAAAEKESVRFQFLCAPIGFEGNDGQARSLTTIRMRLGRPDESGRPRPIPVEDSQDTMGADTIVTAIGQAADNRVLATLGLEVDRRGRIVVDPETLATSRDGVFAGGDAVYGPRTVVEAIGWGRRAAAGIDRYLRGSAHAGVQSVKHVPWPAESAPDPIAPGLEPARRPLAGDDLRPIPRIPMPERALKERIKNFAELELGYSEAQSVAEARRCLACGPCSECMACIHACPHDAIRHDQLPSRHHLKVDAVIHDDNRQTLEALSVTSGANVVRLDGDDPLTGSAVAGQVLAGIGVPVNGFFASEPLAAPMISDQSRVGVFVCCCDDAIARVVDTHRVRRYASGLDHVVHTDVLPAACTHDGAALIRNTAAQQALKQVVVAACSCCALDQTCHSCTYQRIRCKQSMGVFSAEGGLAGITVEFINIREQCAWVHADEPELATQKACALVAAAVARCRPGNAKPPIEQPHRERSVMIVGDGPCGTVCRDLLNRCHIPVDLLEARVTAIGFSDGLYRAEAAGRQAAARAVVLTPANPGQAARIMAAFGTDSRQPKSQDHLAGLNTQLPGVFICSPDHEPERGGQAAAACVMAWLGSGHRRPGPPAAVVDPHRCRWCRTCITVCEFGAPQPVIGAESTSAWVDPLICKGCGTCAAHCPSGAIIAGEATDDQLTATLTAVLSQSRQIE